MKKRWDVDVMMGEKHANVICYHSAIRSFNVTLDRKTLISTYEIEKNEWKDFSFDLEIILMFS